MEKLKYIKIEHQDGTLSENVPIGVDANNVDVGNENLSTKLNTIISNTTLAQNTANSANEKANINTNNINVLTSRVDNLATLEKGSITGDAELIDGRISYNENMAGPRSNLYTLYRASLSNSSVTENIIKQWIDTAYEEHLIIIPFWHDIDFSRDSQGRTKEENLELLEYCIEYALSKGLTFINLGDIPNIM